MVNSSQGVNTFLVYQYQYVLNMIYICPNRMNIFKKCYNFDNNFIFLSEGRERERERERMFFRNKWFENTYHGLKEIQRASRFNRPVAIMGLNGWKKAQCSFQSSYHCFLCYHLCFFHLDWWWNRPTWVLLSKLRVCNIKELEICPIEKNCGTRFFLVINLNSK